MAADIERELRAAATPDRAAHEKAYLKSSLEHAGTPLAPIRSCARRVRREQPDLPPATVFEVARELWSVPLHERRLVAVMVLEQYADRLQPGDLDRLEPYLRDSRTCALIDGVAGDVAATVVARYPDDPDVDATLRRWAGDEDFWVRRSALLAHLRTLSRKGTFGGWDRFSDIADDMLEEREFFIRKAIGWVLREAGKAQPELVTAWLRPRTGRVSGVTIREAVRYLDPRDRDDLLAAYRGR